MRDLRTRVEHLEAGQAGPWRTQWAITADGDTVAIDTDVLDWVREHGRKSADGRDLVDLVPPEDLEDWDALSAAYWSTERQAIQGLVEWPPAIDGAEGD